jgi:hypothetical protein
MKHTFTPPLRPQTASTDASPPKTLADAERRVLERGDVELKPQHPGTADDPESRLHVDGETDGHSDGDNEDERDDALHADEDTLPVFGTHSNH